jgi:hypothetical protein
MARAQARVLGLVLHLYTFLIPFSCLLVSEEGNA